ncbi:MAG: aminomethyl-transferring glycine dehydrogenase subunit GcvPA [Proteobacteria bacterium]|nr:aminomethyl-transferring glycine dehydrogenase subunit GcvPA [Pseudomonadota bacterium]
MPFIPHTRDDVQTMLSAIGVPTIDALFDEIPAHLRCAELEQVPAGVSEMDMLAWMAQRAEEDRAGVCFLGAGCYDHHIPAAVWDLTSRGEFMTAYTPYQAEASQGTLQLIYEYQSMMAALTAMEVSNASVYDGASGLAEAVLMAIRANKKAPARRVLMSQGLHPNYAKAARNIACHQGITFDPLAQAQGVIDLDALPDDDEPVAAIVIQQPNFLGLLEPVDELTDWAQARGALVIAVVNPMTLAVLKPPGQWGSQGADIACGDGQPFGIPMASGGPSFGFVCTRSALVRQMPGRIIGQTEDLDGKTGYTLTLQAREQHIRRGKATSNICTNQGLLVTAGTIYLSLAGPQGLRRTALACHNNTRMLVETLTAIEGVERAHQGAYFHECALRLPGSARLSLARLLDHGILGGLALGDFGGEDNQILVCATEKRTRGEITAYADALREVLA